MLCPRCKLPCTQADLVYGITYLASRVIGEDEDGEPEYRRIDRRGKVCNVCTREIGKRKLSPGTRNGVRL